VTTRSVPNPVELSVQSSYQPHAGAVSSTTPGTKLQLPLGSSTALPFRMDVNVCAVAVASATAATAAARLAI
jgi:hypothetical protein